MAETHKATGAVPGHGAPPLLEQADWMGDLNAWAAGLARPKQILIVSAHWETAPMAIGATRTVPLVYDFYGFPQHYYELQYTVTRCTGARRAGEGADASHGACDRST